MTSFMIGITGVAIGIVVGLIAASFVEVHFEKKEKENGDE